MNGVSIVSNHTDEKIFREFPYKHYADSEHYVPPLRSMVKDLLSRKKNPFYNNAEIELFIAEKNGEVAGRIAAIHNKTYNDYSETKAGFFGFFECIDDSGVAELLFKVAEDWCRERGLDTIIGPFSPNMMGEVGVLVEGFEFPPLILMPYNKPYYQHLLENSGYEKVVDLLAFRVTTDTVALDRAMRAEEIVRHRNPGLVIRLVNVRKFKHEARIIRDIFNQAWAKNWGFCPFSVEEFDHLARDLKSLIDPQFATIAEINGKPVGFSIGLPNYNQIIKSLNGNLFPFGFIKLMTQSKKLTEGRVALMGVLPEYQGKGIDAVLNQYIIRNGMNRGFVTAEMSWLLETNTSMINVAERTGGAIEKRYRIFKKQLDTVK